MQKSALFSVLLQRQSQGFFTCPRRTRSLQNGCSIAAMLLQYHCNAFAVSLQEQCSLSATRAHRSTKAYRDRRSLTDETEKPRQTNLTVIFSSMKIADIDLGERPVLLAPMEDVTDPAFRLMCKEFGADMVYTEFVSADALIRSVSKTEQKLNISDKERPVAIQIYGRDTDTMVEAARIVEQARPDILDLNFGCPVKRVAGKGAGAGMLQNVPLMLEITRAVVDAVKIPVTVKTRLGWDADHKIIVTLAEQLQDCGIAALTIHGRTRAQMYTGEADWTLIGEVKKNPRMRIPVIGNGDITTPQRAKECFDLYGVDGIMIGRASFGRPWVFKEVKHYLETGEELSPLSSEWRLNVLRREVEDSVNLLDERRGILHVRRHLAASPLFKGIPNFRETRIAMLRAETKEELYKIFEEIEPLLPA